MRERGGREKEREKEEKRWDDDDDEGLMRERGDEMGGGWVIERCPGGADGGVVFLGGDLFGTETNKQLLIRSPLFLTPPFPAHTPNPSKNITK